MKPKLIAIYLFIVLLPIGLLGWLGAELARDEQARVQIRFRELLADQLAARNEAIQNLIAQRERELLALVDFQPDVEPAWLRSRIREERLVRQIFILKPNGELLFPLNQSATQKEKDFLVRTRSVWDSGTRFSIGTDSGNSSNAARHGWHTWFWGSGVNLLFWREDPSGHVVGVEVDRMTLAADVTALLPETDLEGRSKASGRVVLADAQNRTLYQWGRFEPLDGAEPDARVPVSDPLSMWTLNFYAAPETLLAAPGKSAWFNMVMILGFGCLVMVGLAVYFFRENTREIREASQRVSFVNQVSHELKTPLTNIRMYAELLQGKLEGSDDGASENLEVIVSESQRLSRMIGNVLTFARRQRESLQLSERTCAPDDAIRVVLDHFRPALDAKNVSVRFDGNAGDPVKLDTDFLEQILGNLFNNVEKYAPDSGEMNVSSALAGDLLTVEVSDRGPGIPVSQREEVFQPFQRLSNQLSDGVTGTGIGLAIARDLARVHGGDLTLEPSERGALFRLTIKVNDGTSN
ncbi:HAMP domain-containing histidine kinase [bacterium]|nr:HAMP domain-containing histidine kinase [bacterium]